MDSRQDSTPSTSHARILRKRRVPLQSSNMERENKIIKLDGKPSGSRKTQTQSNQNTVNFQEKVHWDIFNMKTPEKFQPVAIESPSSPQHPAYNRRFSRRYNPLPSLNWSDSFETWLSMVSRETEDAYQRDENPYKHNPDIQPKMRAILIDWLIEVCDVYKLQRKTLYMAIDYVDRYLGRSKNIQKTSLQLVGITSLFIAAKNEEIYPPKLREFCFITDGACTTDEMLTFELHMLQVLRWKLSPVTPICWLGVFMQVHASKPTDEFLLAHYDQNLFIRVSQLLDLCLMNSDCIQFRYHLLAATALSFYIKSIMTVTQITALSCDEMQDCRNWMLPFYKVLEKENNTSLVCPSIQNVPQELAHNVQTRNVNLELLEKVEIYRETPRPSNRLIGKTLSSSSSGASLSTPHQSLKSTACPSGDTSAGVQVLTPPKSSELKQKSSQTIAVDPNALAVKHINLNSN